MQEMPEVGGAPRGFGAWVFQGMGEGGAIVGVPLDSRLRGNDIWGAEVTWGAEHTGPCYCAWGAVSLLKRKAEGG